MKFYLPAHEAYRTHFADPNIYFSSFSFYSLFFRFAFHEKRARISFNVIGLSMLFISEVRERKNCIGNARAGLRRIRHGKYSIKCNCLWRTCVMLKLQNSNERAKQGKMNKRINWWMHICNFRYLCERKGGEGWNGRIEHYMQGNLVHAPF